MIEWLSDISRRIVDLLDAVDPFPLALLVVAFTMLETTALVGLIVPGEAVLIVAGSASDNFLVYALMVFAATLGTFGGQVGGYAIGRAIGPRFITSRLGRMIGTRRWQEAQGYMSGRGAWVLVPVRFAAIVHVVVPILAGVIRMPIRLFAWWSALGAFLWSATYITIGALAGATVRTNGAAGLVISVAIIALASLAVFLHARHGRRQP